MKSVLMKYTEFIGELSDEELQELNDMTTMLFVLDVIEEFIKDEKLKNNIKKVYVEWMKGE